MIKLKNISNFLFENFNLEIKKGEFVVIIGDNGAGKSTLVNLISGLLLPNKGQILIDSIDVANKQEHERADYIAHVFQDPKIGTNGEMTVRENLSLALHKKDFSLKRAVDKKNDEMFASLVDLDLDQSVGTLSGGQRQRLSLTMATFAKPKLLLLDEHTSALDPTAAKEIMKTTNDIIRQNGLTAIMVTHSIPFATKYGDRLIFMREGKIKFDVKERMIEDVAKMFE